eukprot:6481850-Pyramimonas_sp.AAC.1
MGARGALHEDRPNEFHGKQHRGENDPQLQQARDRSYHGGPVWREEGPGAVGELVAHENPAHALAYHRRGGERVRGAAGR